MNTEILIRSLWAFVIIGSTVALYLLANRLILSRDSAKIQSIENPRRDKPVLLYFTTPTCAPCKTIQGPTIQHLQERTGGQIEVIEIDATVHPEIASQWGVLSVPSIFIIDRQGQARYVNHGVTSADKLIHQLSNL